MSNVNNPGSGGAAQFVTQSELSGSRSVGTVYQNTSSNPMWLAITIYLLASSWASILSDTTNAPAVVVGALITPAVVVLEAQLCVIVPAGSYYSLAQTGGSISVVKWIETV